MAQPYSCAHIKFCSIIGVKELLKSFGIRPLVLNADSEATFEMGIASMSRANFERTGKQADLHFHQERMSKSGDYSFGFSLYCQVPPETIESPSALAW